MGYPEFYLRRDLSRPELMVVASGTVQLPVNRLLPDRDSCRYQAK
jgi:hypothetical protein